VNGIPADSFALSNGNLTISFHFNTSPARQGANITHIAAGAFNCVSEPVLEFTCGFRYAVERPRPTPWPRPTRHSIVKIKDESPVQRFGNFVPPFP
jgi:hypothetical protein